jgi:hypothetical protein
MSENSNDKSVIPNITKGVKSIDLECTGDVCKVKRPSEKQTEKTTLGNPGILKEGKKTEKPTERPTEKTEKTRPTEKPTERPTEKNNDYRQNGKYAVLMETNGQENESWYYFIKYEGNEEALKHLKEQLDLVDFYMLDEFSIFDIELDNLVSAQTAKEMTKLEVNSVMFHRKFDGKMQKINIKLRRNDDNDDMIEKFSDKLGDGQIEDYVSDEDIDEEDLSDGSEQGDFEDSEEDDCEYPETPESSEDSRNTRKQSRGKRDSERTGKDSERSGKEKPKLEHPIPVRTEKGVKFPEKLPADMPKFALRRKKR